MKAPEIGSKWPTWFSDRADGMSTVLAVSPYTGLYRQHFTWVLRLSAPRTISGWMELCV